MDKRDPAAVKRQLDRITDMAMPEHRLKPLSDMKGEPWTWVKQRIERLGDDDPKVRLEADDELSRLKNALDAALELAARSDDPEVRVRAKRLLSKDREKPTDDR